MKCNVSHDVMEYFPKFLDPSVNTKRKILKVLASVFDPLGVLSPVTVGGKLILQRLWKEKFDWDQPITESILEEWKVVVREITKATHLSLPRQLIFSEEIELHAFSDSSSNAYASVVYAVSLSNPDSLTPLSNILIAKGKVAPQKLLNVPKLELMGMILSTRLLSYVTQAFKDHLSNPVILHSLHMA